MDGLGRPFRPFHGGNRGSNPLRDANTQSPNNFNRLEPVFPSDCTKVLHQCLAPISLASQVNRC